MQDNIKTVLIVAVLGTALAVAWLLVLGAKTPRDLRALQVAQSGGSGILDGKAFIGKVGIVGKPLDIDDTWNFASGTFVSTECETRCRYPRAPYYVRQQAGVVEFVGETYCLDKDAKISWQGTVSDGTIKGTFTWNIDRWYWDIEKKFWFEGKLTRQVDEAVANQ